MTPTFRALATGTMGALVATVALVTGASPAVAAPQTEAFAYIPGAPVQTFEVPTDVCALDVTAVGGAGAQDRFYGSYRPAGATVTSRVIVTPGDRIDVVVGGGGQTGTPTVGGAGGDGFATGGRGSAPNGGGGGGATGVSVNGEPVIVAGAGAGGTYGDINSGLGGTPDGSAGGYSGMGGRGGTQTAGGAGGEVYVPTNPPTSVWYGTPGTAGTALAGGDGGTDPYRAIASIPSSGASGGGGGWFGGGGGAGGTSAIFPDGTIASYYGSQGGGGSSLVPAAGTAVVGFERADGSGQVTIEYDPASGAGCPAPGYTVSQTASVESAEPGDVVTYRVTVSATERDITDDSAVIIADLSGVLESATVNSDASLAPAEVDGDTLTWRVSPSLGSPIVIEYRVTVHGDAPDGQIVSTVAAPDGSAGSCDPNASCTATTQIRAANITEPPAPENPDPNTPDPKTPDPEQPDPDQPAPETEQPEPSSPRVTGTGTGTGTGTNTGALLAQTGSDPSAALGLMLLLVALGAGLQRTRRGRQPGA